MKELQEIVKTFEQLKKSGQSAALATVVKTKGSVYRRPGARMLITSEGKTIGTLSGGCLERDVCFHVENSLPSGQPLLVTYDTTTDEDLYLGLGLGCNGIVQILIEKLSSQSKSLNFLANCLNYRQKGVIATVFAVENVPGIQVGNCLTLDATQTLSSDIQNSQLVRSITTDAQLVFQAQKSTINQYQLGEGRVEVFIEVIHPPPSLVIFGAEPDALPVARLAKELGWQVTVIDTRQSQVTASRFSFAHRLILTPPEDACKRVTLNSDALVVVMTHHYLHDLELLKWLLPLTPQYLGILGPRHRSERLLKDLQLEGIVLTNQQRERLYAPVGLDIGAETPEAIALSILSEMQAVLNHRSGQSLREQQSPIHQPLNCSIQTLPLSYSMTDYP